MLQIKQVCKEYRTGSLVQKALDHVDVSFRDSEFVAILGPSGSGKTTLLNSSPSSGLPAPARRRCSTLSAGWTATTAATLS